jgi:hypothetical protein
MKRKYESSNIIMLPDNSDVSNDTFEQKSQQQPIDLNDIISTTTNYDIGNLDNQLDAQLLQQQNQLLMKHLDLSDGKSRHLGLVKEYISKDKSLIQEYEGLFTFEGKFIPLYLITNATRKKIVSCVVDPSMSF